MKPKAYHKLKLEDSKPELFPTICLREVGGAVCMLGNTRPNANAKSQHGSNRKSVTARLT
ncbi:MAG: hypothetical protein LBK47_09615 [Prevotellaceae bacterium]|jgi:hypothetical protein|nr:hypothetical protein [Prevotellaceae bacterium]